MSFQISYIGSNILGGSLAAGDTAESSSRITKTDGVLRFDFGNVYIPPGKAFINFRLHFDLL